MGSSIPTWARLSPLLLVAVLTIQACTSTSAPEDPPVTASSPTSGAEGAGPPRATATTTGTGEEQDPARPAARTMPDLGAGWVQFPTEQPTSSFAEAVPSTVTAWRGGFVAIGWDLFDGGGVVWEARADLQWERVPTTGDRIWTVSDIASSAETLVAVGGTNIVDAPFTPPRAEVWTSTDAVDWSQVPHDENIFGAGFMTAIASSEIGWVAAGYDDADAPIVWHSPDALTWTRSSLDHPVQHLTQVTDVTGGPDGYVAVGIDYTDQSGVVWFSPDGVSWERVEPAIEPFTDVGLAAVARGPTGYVASGIDLTDPGIATWTGVWTSETGRDWIHLPLSVESVVEGGSGGFVDITVDGGQIIAAGLDFEAGSGVWTSPDGAHWARTGDFGDDIPSALAANDNRFAAATMDPSMGSGSLWTATEGTDWIEATDRATDPFLDSDFAGTDAGGDSVVVFGSDLREISPTLWTSHPQDRTVWIRASVEGATRGIVLTVAAFDGGWVAAGRTEASWGDAVAWYSTDSGEWVQASIDEGENGVMSDVVAYRELLIAVGQLTHDQTEYAAFWTSEDGTTWDKVPRNESMRGADILAVAANGNGVVAVGDNAFDGRRWEGSAWFSADGRNWRRTSGPFTGSSLNDVAADESVYVAVGAGMDWDYGLSWTSTNGLSWFASAEFPEVLIGVTSFDGLFVALDRDAHIWVSIDGDTWSQATRSPIAETPVAIASTDTELIVAGTDENDRPAVWIWTAPAP